MGVIYKIDVLSELKTAGYNTNRIRKERILSEGVLQKFRTGEIVNGSTLAKLCQMLNLQPGDILEYVPDNEQ